MGKARGDKSLNSSSENCGLSSIDEVLDRFHYIRAQSLPHLLSLLIHSPPEFPGQETSLLVVDSISAFFPSYFPNTTELKSQLKEGRIPDNQHLQWLLNRKWTIAGDIATHLMKLTASHQHLAVVLTNQTHTKIRGQLQATLFPVVSGGSWDAGIHNRIVLYRDWSFEAHDYASQNSLEDNPPNSQLRYAEVIKRGGRTLTTRFKENIAPFVITNDGLCELRQDSKARKEVDSQPLAQIAESHPIESPALSINQSRKRKVDEVADSEDDDDDESFEAFDWIGNDDSALSDSESFEGQLRQVKGASKGEDPPLDDFDSEHRS